MKILIFGCVLVLTGTALAAGQMLPDAQMALVGASEQAIPRAAQENRQMVELTPSSIAVSDKRAGAFQVAPQLPVSPMIAVTGLDSSSPESSQPRGRDLKQRRTPTQESLVAVSTKARQLGRNPCTYLGCRGHTVVGIGF